MDIGKNSIIEYSLRDITLWLLNLEKISEEDLNRMYACCSKRRREAADRIKPDMKRKQSVGAGYLLYCLQKRFSIAEEPVLLHGKPVFRKNADVHFNISHSGGYAALAFGNMPLGVDIECIKQANLRVAGRFFLKEEYDYITEKPEREQADAFFRIWTRKEAVVKAVGSGLRIPLNDFSVMGEIVECHGEKYELYQRKLAEAGKEFWIAAARLII